MVRQSLPWYGNREVHRMHLAQAKAMNLWQEYVDAD